MSAPLVESRDLSSSTASHMPGMPGPQQDLPPPPKENNVAVVDIGSFVANYSKMAECFYPLELACTAVLYVVRWENYFLTTTTLILLCVLFYHPALLAGCVVGVSIIGMAIGKYYSQSKRNTLLRLGKPPEVQYLNEEHQMLLKYQKEQKSTHKILLEYRRIMCRAEAVITQVTKALEYLYKIVLWESLEVSLCVTVLLCVLFALLCTVYLRVLSASFPLIIFCFNRHFIKRTLELWKSLLRFVYSKVRLKRRDTKQLPVGSSQGAEVTHHSDAQSTAAAHSEAVPNVGLSRGDTPDLQTLHTSSGEVSQDGRTTNAAKGAHGAAGGSDTADKEGGNSIPSKGFCTKCNTSFAKLLKRKHDCNYCGQTFCGSCTVKVKRAVLGATSPAAFEESVRVCLDCKHLLDDLKLAQNSISAS